MHVSREDGSGAQWLLASNLSEGGIFVRCGEPPAAGTKLRLDLEARGQTLRFGEGEVIWSRPMDVTRLNQGLPGFGIKFTELSAESSALVKHLVDVGGTGRGQAKTLPFTSPEAFVHRSREPLHAPVAAMVESLVATEKAPTGDWPMLSPIEEKKISQKVVVDFAALGEEPLSLGVGAPLHDDEPRLDREMLKASIGTLPEPSQLPRRSNGIASVAAGFALFAITAGGGFYAWRGFHTAMDSDATNEPVTVVTSKPTSPEGEGELTAATVEPEDDAEEAAAPEPAKPAAKPVVEAAKPAPKPVEAVKPIELKVVMPAVVAKAKVVSAEVPHVPAAKPSPKLPARGAQIALPSGAAKAVAVSDDGAALEIRPELAPGAEIDRVFALSSPARLVIDLKGPTPHGTPKVEGRNGVTAVRLGMRPGGTRLVLDLVREAAKVKNQDGAITVELH
ncbi:MAG: PilZ domain-containing protein [Deltaproteobacteria bacterium]|nr:PilZ domain-containing protein [Deltaproteobacteria bacterium]